ncbi:MAG: peptidoglycan DD-metalloendopeptidase family protein [Bacteroidetes bacterium]|nr:peptidoglycan DD-metalloendopeptidase family protein [Bacteroidota bacterium]
MQKIVFTLVLLSFVFFSCNNKYAIDALPKDTTPPTISYPVVSFSSTTQFTPFGGTVPATSEISKGYTIHLTDPNLTINSATAGSVTAVSANSVMVLYKTNSIYCFYYSGLQNIMVSVGQTVAPGTILGHITATGDVFFQVIKNDTEVNCPDTFSDNSFKMAIQTAITKHIMNNPADSLMTSCTVTSLPR